jgi:hypothetical protein
MLSVNRLNSSFHSFQGVLLKGDVDVITVVSETKASWNAFEKTVLQGECQREGLHPIARLSVLEASSHRVTQQRSCQSIPFVLRTSVRGSGQSCRYMELSGSRSFGVITDSAVEVAAMPLTMHSDTSHVMYNRTLACRKKFKNMIKWDAMLGVQVGSRCGADFRDPLDALAD